MISVLIMTLNEEVNIEACISSLPWRSDIHVLDSGSTDETTAIAHHLGARVTVRPFTTFAEQRNHALSLPGQYPWVVMLDADERMTPELALEIETCVRDVPDDTTMFRVRRKDMFMGRWLRHASGYPTWFPRVFRRDRVDVKRDVHETFSTDGNIRHLTSHLIHYPFNKGIDWWIERHNAYATSEAKVVVEDRTSKAQHVSRLFASDPADRRAALKVLGYRLPFRPTLVFAYLYVARFGFLDGRAGYHYASLRAAYETMIDAKVAALEDAKQHTAPMHKTMTPPG